MTLNNVLLVKSQSSQFNENHWLPVKKQHGITEVLCPGKYLDQFLSGKDFFWIMVQFKSNLLRGIAFILIIYLDENFCLPVCIYVCLSISLSLS